MMTLCNLPWHFSTWLFSSIPNVYPLLLFAWNFISESLCNFQPPLWERYQKQVREWELAMTKNNAPSNGCLDKVTTLEKPAMFAFCLKPRGLESLNKGLKHRSQKKISVSGHANSNLDQDGFHTFSEYLIYKLISLVITF